MITRYALIAALVAVLGGGVSLWWVVGQRNEARATAAQYKLELDTAATRLKQAQAAAAVHNAYAAQLRLDLAKAKQAEQEALEAVGHDEDLPDYLRRIIDGLRSGNSSDGVHGTSGAGRPAPARGR